MIFKVQINKEKIFNLEKTAIQDALQQFTTESGINDLSESNAKKKLRQWAIKAIQNNASDLHIYMEPSRTRIDFRKDGVINRSLRITDDYRAVKAVVRTIYDKGRAKQEYSESSTQSNSYCFTVTDFDIPDESKPGHRKHIDSIDVTLRIEKALYETKIRNANQAQKAVIRISTTQQSRNLEQLSIPAGIRKQIELIMQRPSGFIIISGPTGSGKSTLAHGALHYIPEGKVLEALEDPVEVIADHNSLITQSNVSPTEGFNFQLRSLMRKDPDGIFIGEMRDSESAAIGMTAASTGHLVLTTTHANNTLLTLVRLKDLGISYADMGTEGTLSMFLAQRLVPKLCQHCATITSNNELYTKLKLHDAHLQVNKNEITIKHCNKNGCVHCTNGIVGRLPIIEYLLFDKPIYQYIREEKIHEIEPYIRKQGWLSLADRARIACSKGLVDPLTINLFVENVFDEIEQISYV
ncbi:GspE/PulE family protein [Photobacterium kishitanii]|nr:ATPase, T2SS/T4P/T4SS family [Photobacterium kishitanii]